MMLAMRIVEALAIGQVTGMTRPGNFLNFRENIVQFTPLFPLQTTPDTPRSFRPRIPLTLCLQNKYIKAQWAKKLILVDAPSKAIALQKALK
jgi:hypothetical protein